MNNNQVEILGRIKSANIQHPVECWEDECFKYTLTLAADSYADLCDIEVAIYEAKKRHKELAEIAAVPSSEDYGTRKDKIFDGSLLCFESLYKPKLESYLANKSDQDLLWIWVRVYGEIKIHKDGNAYITCTQVTPWEAEREVEEVVAVPAAGDW